MILNPNQKEDLKRDLVDCLKAEPEVRRIVLFGSFLNTESPNDMDIAVFQDSGEDYLPLALKYRRMIRPVTARIPVDVIPLKWNAPLGDFLSEVETGEVLYEG